MSHYAIVVDLDRCIGCHGCEIACKNENEVELGSFWNKVMQVGPFGDYPHLHQYFLPVMCQQCDDSPCTHVCPTGASYRDENNVVLVDKEKCIGCKYCMMACPYGVRSWNAAESVGSLLRRSGRSEFGRLQSACRRRRRLGSSPEGRGQRPSDGLHPVSQVR